MRSPKRGEVYLSKQDALGKRRPMVVMSIDRLNGGNSVVAVPFYSQQLDKRAGQEHCARFDAGEAGLEKTCVAKCDEIGVIDKLDIDLARGAIGRLNESQLARVEAGIKYSLGLS